MTIANVRNAVKGISVSPGEAVARICLYSSRNYQKSALRMRRENLSVDAETLRFYEAVSFCKDEILKLREKVWNEMGSAEAAVLDAQQALLEDPEIHREIVSLIRSNSVPFESAADTVFTRYEEFFISLENDYLKQRSTDLSEVKNRLLNFGFKTDPGFVCTGMKKCGNGVDSIIVTDVLTSTMMMEIDLSRVKGIITEKGGVNGHAAMLARSAGIPAVTGVEDVLGVARCGNMVLLNGTQGTAVFNPHPDEIASAANDPKIETSEPEQLVSGVTLLANCASVKDVEDAVHANAEGVGLLRTEMLFLKRGYLLSESEQVELYSDLCRAAAGRTVTFRLLDVGADKPFPFLKLPEEENPSLGMRGARFLLANPDILRTQVVALLKTACRYPLKIMIPMIVDIAQFRKFRQIICEEAVAVGCDLSAVHVGLMFEVPSALFQVQQLIEESDFASIGSNDLLQYLIAVDRNNRDVADEYDMAHPALWECMKRISEVAESMGKMLTICGELAAIPAYARELCAIGIKALSVPPALLPAIRKSFSGYK